MFNSKWIVRQIVVIGVIGLNSYIASAIEPQEQIEYRKSVMKTLDEGVAAYRSAVELGAPSAELAKHLKLLSLTSGQIKKAFEPRVEGGRAKTDVWKKWPDFVKRAESQGTRLRQLSDSVASGAVSTKSIDLNAALGCAGCHDAYRRPQK